jgi:uncharacterized repeat protein (TIGR01451 family)
MKLFSYLKRAPKRIGLFLVLFLALIALPLRSVMAADVLMEGSIGVANQTTGETTYKPSTSAKYDQVVKFSVYYHNRELPESNRVAENFKIKVDMPTAAGTNQVVKVTMKGDNTNTVTDTATVTLDRADATLEFIPGSVYWKHNVGTRTDQNLVTQQIADSVILNGAVIENVKPCHEFEATVTFMARVKIPSVGIYKYVHADGGTTQATDNLVAQPGTRVEYIVQAKNLSNTNLTNVYLRDPLPKGVTFVPGTAKKFYGSFNGTVMTADEANAFFNGRKNVGTLLPGASALITFVATVDPGTQLACGMNNIKNIAVVDTDQTGEYNDSATVNVNKDCVTTAPAYRCDLLELKRLDGRKVNLNVKYTATNGATFKNVTYDFGDGSAALVTDKVANVEHTYAKDGEYNLTATVRFNVNGVDQTSACTAKVNYNTPETPTTLVNTGAGDVLGIFAAVTVAGAMAHRLILSRRIG